MRCMWVSVVSIDALKKKEETWSWWAVAYEWRPHKRWHLVYGIEAALFHSFITPRKKKKKEREKNAILFCLIATEI